MGVQGLWQILDRMELAEEKHLGFLSGKRVAIDLSGWVVQAIQCPGLNNCKKPYLKNLFHRVKRLLENGVFPICILEGEMPDLKEAVCKARNQRGFSQSTQAKGLTRSKFDLVLKECEKLLQSLGIPCFKSSGEAEALCAFLYVKKVVEGVITEDSDAFLYGADTVLRDFSANINNPHITVYSLKSDKNTLELDQPKLIALALLLGCDYGKGGVPGIGQEYALKLISELNGKSLIERFKEWKQMSEFELFPGYDPTVKKQGTHCKQCTHLGSLLDHKNTGCIMCKSSNECFLSEENPCSCAWHKTQEINLKNKVELKVYNAARKLQDFPNLKIVEEFMNYTDSIPDRNELEWKCPNLKEFQCKAYDYFNWTPEYCHENVLPLITLWQQFRICDDSTKSETFLFKPVKIQKQRIKKKVKCLEVLWTEMNDNSDTKQFCTVEDEERFNKAYPELSNDFYNSLKKPKQEPKSPKDKSQKSRRENKQITEYFPATKNLTPRVDSEVKPNFPEKRVLDQTSDENEQNSKKLCVPM